MASDLGLHCLPVTLLQVSRLQWVKRQWSFLIRLNVQTDLVFFYLHMSQCMTKPTKWHVCPVKPQISLGIHPFWSESLLCTQWVAKNPRFLHVDSKDSDQTGQMPRLIWVFAGRTCSFVGFVMCWLICNKGLFTLHIILSHNYSHLINGHSSKEKLKTIIF